jgi:hypothetical protein
LEKTCGNRATGQAPPKKVKFVLENQKRRVLLLKYLEKNKDDATKVAHACRLLNELTEAEKEEEENQD